jgi:dihydrofolate reductase
VTSRLKALPRKYVNVAGSARLVQSLWRLQLLNELRLLVHPIVARAGKRLPAGETNQHPLRPVEARTCPTGMLCLTYQPAAR